MTGRRRPDDQLRSTPELLKSAEASLGRARENVVVTFFVNDTGTDFAASVIAAVKSALPDIESILIVVTADYFGKHIAGGISSALSSTIEHTSDAVVLLATDPGAIIFWQAIGAHCIAKSRPCFSLSTLSPPISAPGISDVGSIESLVRTLDALPSKD